MTDSNTRLPLALVHHLPPSEPVLLSSLDADIEPVRRLQQWVRSHSVPTTTQLGCQQLSATPLTVRCDDDQSLPSSSQSQSDTDIRYYFAYHNPTHMHSTHIATNADDSDESLLVSQCERQLQHARHVLRSLTAKKRRVEAKMDALHRYNDLKDIGQIVMGQLAVLENTMTRDYYPKYGLDIDD